MATVDTMAAGLRASSGSTGTGRRIYALTVALFAAALFSGLSTVYFAVNAGADYPEPLALLDR